MIMYEIVTLCIEVARHLKKNKHIDCMGAKYNEIHTDICSIIK